MSMKCLFLLNDNKGLLFEYFPYIEKHDRLAAQKPLEIQKRYNTVSVQNWTQSEYVKCTINKNIIYII